MKVAKIGLNEIEGELLTVDCRKAYQAEYNRLNQWRIKARRASLWEYANAVKTEKGCCFCVENDPCCLDFHHRDSQTKSFEISKGINWGFGEGRIKTEIAKCEVVCANCHRKLHFGRVLEKLLQMLNG